MFSQIKLWNKSKADLPTPTFYYNMKFTAHALLALVSGAVFMPSMTAATGIDCTGDNVFCNPWLNKCYCFDPTFRGNYEAAADACVAQGYSLATIFSKDERDAILQWSTPLVQEQPRAWVGLLKRAAEGSLTPSWMTGESLRYAANHLNIQQDNWHWTSAFTRCANGPNPIFPSNHWFFEASQ